MSSVPMKRSAIAFARGARVGTEMIRIAAPAKTASIRSGDGTTGGRGRSRTIATTQRADQRDRGGRAAAVQPDVNPAGSVRRRQPRRPLRRQKLGRSGRRAGGCGGVGRAGRLRRPARVGCPRRLASRRASGAGEQRRHPDQRPCRDPAVGRVAPAVRGLLFGHIAVTQALLPACWTTRAGWSTSARSAERSPWPPTALRRHEVRRRGGAPDGRPPSALPEDHHPDSVSTT